MKTFVCIDDTDNLETRGTGELARQMIEELESMGLGQCSDITRHQLYFHPDIPYTSHNSAMCFIIEHRDPIFQTLKCFSEDFLLSNSAEGSDPGLCIAEISSIKDQLELMNYGFRAKKEILSKALAYETAFRLDIHLSEHGGTGGGVIGALAGVALRLSGNDGRFKGKIYFPIEGNTLRVGDILDNSNITKVQSLEGRILEAHQEVVLGEKVKAVLLDHQKVLLVYSMPHDKAGRQIWHTCTKQQLSVY